MRVGAWILWELARDRELVVSLRFECFDLFLVFVEEREFLSDHIAAVWAGDIGDPVDGPCLVREDSRVGIRDRRDRHRSDRD